MTAPRLFGTDGMRGVFGEPPLDRGTVTALGAALGAELRARGGGRRVLLGGDTRDSTPTLCAWLADGLAAGGAGVLYGGMLPTPAIAWLTMALGTATGIAVSASHNPYPDNGIKLIDAEGFKWSPEREAALEERMLAAGVAPERERELPIPQVPLAEMYVEGLLATLAGELPLAGLKVALDAAHGAAAPFAAELFTRAGAEVAVIGDQPDGTNINRGCGSTHPEALARLTRGGFDLGIAFDGDADRALLVDERGEVRDGDAILYLWARAMKAAGTLDGGRVVATSMSNLGLERALARLGVRVERCGVGDREVVATLKREGLVLGGEQSGHIVNLRLSTTGDGLLTALHMARLVARERAPLSVLLAPFERFPQVLKNVRVRRKERLEDLPGVAAAVERVERALGSEGRLVLRFSGTEPLARIMIEGPEQATIEALADDIAREIEGALA